MYLPSSWQGTRCPVRKLRTSTAKYTCLRGCQDPTMWAWEGTRHNKGYCIFLERLPKAEEGEPSGRGGEPEPVGTGLPCHWDWASQRGRWDTLGEQELTEAREAQWQDLAVAAILEECIERLSQSTTRMGPDVCCHSKSQDQPRRRPWGWSHRHPRAPPEEDHQAWSPSLSLISSH